MPASRGPQARARSSRWTTLGIALILLAALAHIVYLRFVCDDAYITFRYAAHLAQGLGPVYNAGERVEGYSNFLWMLILAAVIRLGGQPEVWAPILSAACALATLLVAIRWFSRRGGNPIFVAILLAVSSAWAAWATSGLETALYSLLLTAGCLTTLSALGVEAARSRATPTGGEAPAREAWRGWSAGAWLLALASLTRPEGALVSVSVGAVLLVLVLGRTLTAGAWLRWLGVWLAGVLPFEAWRLAYYGRFLPNSFLVKAPGPMRFAAGAHYLLGATVGLELWLLALPIFAALALRRLRGLNRLDLSLIAGVVIPYLLYVATTGGDFMPLFRYVVPLVPLITIVAAAALEGAASRPGRPAPPVAAVVTGAFIAAYALLNLHGSRDQQQVWARDQVGSVGAAREDTENWSRVGLMLKILSAPADTLATTAAGIIPYRSGLYTIDLLGLNAPDLSRYRPRAVPAAPGHQLILSAPWIERLRPQFLLGHPMIKTSPQHVGLSLDLDPESRERIDSNYTLAGFKLQGRPERYIGCMIRNDAMDRVIVAAARWERRSTGR